MKELKAEMKRRRMKGYTGLNIQALKDMLKKEVGSQMTLIMRGKSSGRGRKGLGKKEDEEEESKQGEEAKAGSRKGCSHEAEVTTAGKYGDMEKPVEEFVDPGKDGEEGEGDTAARDDPVS